MKQTLLLVEDDKNLADGLLVSLEQAGYDCLHAETIADVKQHWDKAVSLSLIANCLMVILYSI
ncbi:transcriptional regulator [Vibrio cholerae]|nr:transcriptional regulator [Vibrio cholerae]